MNPFTRTWRSLMAATKAFRETYTSTKSFEWNEDFHTFDGRSLRYAILWAMYENTAYRDVHTWAQSYKTTFGLYRFIRAVQSPAFRLGDFWQSHLWGGLLDPAAGDGKSTPSALPIITPKEDVKLRAAIAKIWEWSNWQSEKDVVALRGAVLGDTFIKIMDDSEKRRAYMLPVHPGKIKELETDTFGNVKEYVLEESRPDPVNGRPVTYREEVTRNGDAVVYRTYLNGTLYPWANDLAEYAVNYTFVPMVFIRHRNMGLPWGWSELHAGLSNFREVDDQASLLNDQIRKMVNSVWFFAGVSGSSSGTTVPVSTPSEDSPEAGREDMPAIYGPLGATANPLVSTLDITATGANIEKLVAKIERDYPELSEDIANAGGDISGRALRINRQPIIDRVLNRRPNYDSALVRAHQMAIAIAGWNGYDTAFEGYDLGSYAAGTLEHSIGDRPVFAKDPLDDLEVDKAFWEAANAAKTAGGMTGMKMFFEKQGWSKKQIDEFMNSDENLMKVESQRMALDAQKKLQAGEGNQPPHKETDPSTQVK